MHGFAAVVILYHPDRDILENIRSYAPLVSKIYVYDNSENPDDLIQQELISFPKIFYFQDGINQGMARRLNQACTQAVEDGFEWLLTMDQDSRFELTHLSDYFNCIALYEHKEAVAMFGVQFEHLRTGGSTCEATKVTQLITSGSLLNLALFKSVGPFDEALFIDMVDIEYCYRAVLKNYPLIQFQNIFLRHSLGKKTFHRSLKTGKVTPRIVHAPVRMYYIIRNFLYVSKAYGRDLPAAIQFNRAGVLNRIKNNLLYNPQRWQVARFILKAVLDHARNKMGKLN